MKKKLNNRWAAACSCPGLRTVLIISVATLTTCSGGKEGDDTSRPEDQAAAAVSRGIVASVKTIHPRYTSISYPLQVTGVVTYDPRRIHTISARAEGRLEKMYVKYPFQKIRRGQKIAEIYSPELSAAARELRLIAATDPNDQRLMAAAKERLRSLGLRATEIDNAARGGIPTFPLHSPYAGYVLPFEGAPGPEGSSPESTGDRRPRSMDAGRRANEMSPALPREGDYVSAGETVLRIANAEAVRVELDVHNFNADAVATGDTIALNLGDQRPRAAVVDFIKPYIGQGETFSRIRVTLDDAAQLRIGQLVEGTITLRSTETLWLPREAVMDLGSGEVVFAKVHGAFVPIRVSSGIRTRDLIEIKSGLATGDEVAANAHFLMDRDSFVKPVD